MCFLTHVYLHMACIDVVIILFDMTWWWWSQCEGSVIGSFLNLNYGQCQIALCASANCHKIPRCSIKAMSEHAKHDPSNNHSR